MEHQEFDDISYILLARFFEGNASAEDMRSIEKWKQKSSENAALYAKAKMIWLESVPDHFENEADFSYDANAAWTNVASKIVKPETVMRRMPMLIRVAAVLAVVATISFVIISQLKGPNPMVEVHATETGQEVVLEDGSEIELNETSTLEYSTHFRGKTREVVLTGEAFFEIARDTTKPFVVHANDIDIKVLGTSFNVNAHSKDSVEVQVETGIVELVYRNERIKLIAGETGVFQHSLGKFFKRESRVVVSQFWRNRKLTFKRTELIEIVETLNDLYDVNIQVDETTERHRKINVRFEDQDIDLILDILASTLNLNVVKTDSNEVILYNAE
ncbi:MAG: transmembrane sensor [Bacteroidia bacterium]|jgi:transmembrane sensor